MRQITVRYEGNCRKCDATLPIGTGAMYDRLTGIFCLSCAPTDPEEIRKYRQERAEGKAERYEGWAAQRRERAGATLQHNARYTEDIAFSTQPGHIPLRARVIAQNDRACESLNVARHFEDKAQRLRKVRVAGDAEKARQAARDSVRAVLKPGMAVHSLIYGGATIIKVNKKTATIAVGRTGSRVTDDLSFLKLPEVPS